MIYFECLGFSTNPDFIDIEGEMYPQNVGHISSELTKEGWTYVFSKFEWGLFSDSTSIDEDAIVAAYNEQLDKHGVTINDISKGAWLEDRYGEPQVDK